MNASDIYGALRSVIRPGDKLIVIHSSLLDLRPENPDIKWSFLSALRQLLQEGMTLAVPTFSWRFCGGHGYDHVQTPSEAGQLGDWFLSLNDVSRTAHPIYSFAVAGPAAEKIIACPHSSAFGADSPFGYFDRHKARIVMMGCGWEYMTQFHFYEEEARVPYRYFKTFAGDANFGFGSRAIQAPMYVRDYEIKANNDFFRQIEALRNAGALAGHLLGAGMVEAVSCADLGLVCRRQLKDDGLAMVAEPAAVRQRIEIRDSRETMPSLRAAIVCQGNGEFIASAFKEILGKWINDRDVDVYSPDFGQTYQEILNPKSGLWDPQPDFLMFPDRLEDIYGVTSVADISRRHEGVLENHIDMIERALENFKGTALVNRFVRMGLPVWGGATPSGIFDEANRLLEEVLGKHENVHLFDLENAALRFSGPQANDARLYFLGRFPYSQAFSAYLAERYARLVLAARGRAIRLLVIDLDNTLWGGVLGEDGITGLQLGGDFPGNAYLHFQKTLKKLTERGIALAIISKNDEDLALAAMETLPDMIVRESGLAAYRINWREKWLNMIDIAEETGLGLTNIGFLDDNPSERAQMRAQLPEVHVIDLPSDPSLYAETLLDHPFMECLSLTPEDQGRAKSYVSRRRLIEEKECFSRPEDYLTSLNQQLDITGLSSTNSNRAIQLINKTNQFNTTARRYTQKELEALISQDHSVYVLGLRDRFCDFEYIGLAVLRWDHPQPGSGLIELFLLSCRVLGRGLEDGFLAWLINEGRRRGKRTIVGTLIETPRNTPVRDIYDKSGFKPDGDSGRWRLDLGGKNSRIPEWIVINDKTRDGNDAR